MGRAVRAMTQGPGDGSVETGPLRKRGSLEPAAHTELSEDVRDVDARGLLRDVEILADLTVGPAGCHEAQDLRLPGGQPEPAGSIFLDHGGLGDVEPDSSAARDADDSFAQQV